MSNHIDLQGSLREVLLTVTGILSDAVNLDLPEPDMTVDQKFSAAEALSASAGIFRSWAGDFRKIARSEAA